MTTVDTKPPCGPACCTHPCERAETVEAKARDALALLIERHNLPRPAGVRWDELGSVLTVSLGSDTDVDSWAVAMLREPWPQFAGRDDQTLPGAWSVQRSYGYSVERWMGVGVALVVSHNESRVAHEPAMVLHGCVMSDNRRWVLQEIARDAEADVKRFEGAPFNGRTVAEYMGCQAAAIAALAKVVESLLPAASSAAPAPRLRSGDCEEHLGSASASAKGGEPR